MSKQTYKTQQQPRNTQHQPRNTNHQPHRTQHQPHHKAKPVVVSKSDDTVGPTTYSSKWVPSRSGGLMAAIRVNGRVVFPDSRSAQPTNNGKNWAFEIVGENTKQTVYFARIIVPTTVDGAIKIVVDASGKMICIGRRPLVTRFRSTKPAVKQLAEFRSACASDIFVSEGGEFSLENEREDDEDDTFDDDANYVGNWLRSKPVSCHACGFEDCKCDGTSSDWVPARTTLNVLA